MNFENFQIDLEDDGIALLTFDVPARTMNTFTNGAIAELPAVIEALRSDEKVKAVLLCSGKSNGFCAGADLGDLAEMAGTRIVLPTLGASFRALETIGKPVAVALEGLALGGGFEFALACHYRVAAESSKVRFGLPEVSVGLLPGAGGTQRLPRLVGVAKALPMLLEGKPVDAIKALEMGLVHELAPAGQTVAAARRWLLASPDATAPWDRKNFRVPGGLPYSPGGMQTFVMANAMLRKTTHGNFPAAQNIVQAVFEGLQLPMDRALRVEGRYFVNTVATPQARAMIRTLFLSRQALAKGETTASAPAPARAVVIGAGMMGAGIAYSQAARGIETTLIDVDEASAERGKDYSRSLVEKAVSRGRMSAEAGEALLARIAPSAGYGAIGQADLVVEAVFEDIELKHDIIRRVEQHLRPGAIFGSNTSTLPITSLAEASSRPAEFVGIHFFSPVDKMELVEIIRGERTSEETIARAVAYVIALGKTPIVVNDSRGFYTSRCFGSYIYEGLEMLAEGVPPALIENAGRMTGMPRGPLELTDDVAVDLFANIDGQMRSVQLGEGAPVPDYALVLAGLVSQGRLGRKSEGGFYDYPKDGPKRLWSGLAELVPGGRAGTASVDVAALKQRLLHRQALETARCFDEGVIDDPRAADVGAILGWGFAPWTGGPLSYINEIGTTRFVEECDALARQFGPRFAVPDGLRRMSERGDAYYEAPAKAVA